MTLISAPLPSSATSSNKIFSTTDVGCSREITLDAKVIAACATVVPSGILTTNTLYLSGSITLPSVFNNVGVGIMEYDASPGNTSMYRSALKTNASANVKISAASFCAINIL